MTTLLAKFLHENEVDDENADGNKNEEAVTTNTNNNSNKKTGTVMERKRRMKQESYEEDPKEFPKFPELGEDLCRHILTFVTFAPFEVPPETSKPNTRSSSWFGRQRANRQQLALRPTLTSVFPYTSKQFYEWSKLDEYWKAALLRQLEKQPNWKTGLRRVQQSLNVADGGSNSEQLLEAVIQALQSKHLTTSSYKDLYRLIYTHHICIEAPMFLMPCGLRLGEPYGLHLFEPRYQLMVRELIDNNCANPSQARKGNPIVPARDPSTGMDKPPLLFHACQMNRLGPGDDVCLVQIVWCHISAHGEADVQLLPIAWVKLDKIWVRPASGHLVYGKGKRT